MTVLFDEIRKLSLPPADYAIFGSGPLLVRQIIPTANDLDVVCRGDAWTVVSAAGSREYLSDYGVSIVSMCEGRLTFGRKWGIGEFDTDLLIDGAEQIDGLPFVRLKHVAAYKNISGRPKDIEHLEALEAYIESNRKNPTSSRSQVRIDSKK